MQALSSEIVKVPGSAVFPLESDWKYLTICFHPHRLGPLHQDLRLDHLIKEENQIAWF